MGFLSLIFPSLKTMGVLPRDCRISGGCGFFGDRGGVGSCAGRAKYILVLYHIYAHFVRCRCSRVVSFTIKPLT